MEVLDIKTIGDLLTDELLKNNTDITDELKKLDLPHTTSISGAIKHCIDNEKLEFGKLLKLLWDRKYGIGSNSPFEYILRKEKYSMADKMLENGFDINSCGL